LLLVKPLRAAGSLLSRCMVLAQRPHQQKAVVLPAGACFLLAPQKARPAAATPKPDNTGLHGGDSRKTHGKKPVSPATPYRGVLVQRNQENSAKNPTPKNPRPTKIRDYISRIIAPGFPRPDSDPTFLDWPPNPAQKPPTRVCYSAGTQAPPAKPSFPAGLM